MKLSHKVWLTIGGIVVVHNIRAEAGGTLSEAVDEWIATHPVLTRSVIAAFALHLANAVPSRVDPIHLAFTSARTVSRRRVVVVVEAQTAQTAGV
jgi:hypothetical protein